MLSHRCHPGVLQALIKVANRCREAGKPMSVCGEMRVILRTAVLLDGDGLRCAVDENATKPAEGQMACCGKSP